jgi:hypothetical protein
LVYQKFLSEVHSKLSLGRKKPFIYIFDPNDSRESVKDQWPSFFICALLAFQGNFQGGMAGILCYLVPVTVLTSDAHSTGLWAQVLILFLSLLM